MTSAPTRRRPRPTPTESRLAAWRTDLGRSTRLWSGGGTHVVEPERWVTLSGRMAVDYNVACCHGPARADLERSLEEVSATRRPTIVMVAGAALGAVSVLADAGWVCIGSDPFMRLELVGPADTDGSAGADAGGAVGSSSGGPGRGGGGGGSGRERGGPVLLDGAGVAELRMAMEQAFGISADLAELAMPGTVASDDPGHDDDFEAWGLYENGSLVSGTALVRAGESVCVWSMATPPELQGRGFGRRLLAGALESAAAKGASQCLLIASPAGERLYRALGFDLVEHWQLWTRPRWVLA